MSGAALLRGGDSAHAGSRLMMSDDTGDGDGNGHAFTDRWLRVLWLAAIRDAGGGGGAVAPPINVVEWCISGVCSLGRDHWKSCR